MSNVDFFKVVIFIRFEDFFTLMSPKVVNDPEKCLVVKFYGIQLYPTVRRCSYIT